MNKTVKTILQILSYIIATILGAAGEACTRGHRLPYPRQLRLPQRGREPTGGRRAQLAAQEGSGRRYPSQRPCPVQAPRRLPAPPHSHRPAPHWLQLAPHLLESPPSAPPLRPHRLLQVATIPHWMNCFVFTSWCMFYSYCRHATPDSQTP